jgi:hypothetical protein
MLVENRKNHLQFEISEADWQQIKFSGKQLLYKIIYGTPKVATKVNVPKEIREFQIKLPQAINPQPVNPEKINIFKKPQHKHKSKK